MTRGESLPRPPLHQKRRGRRKSPEKSGPKADKKRERSGSKRRDRKASGKSRRRRRRESGEKSHRSHKEKKEKEKASDKKSLPSVAPPAPERSSKGREKSPDPSADKEPIKVKEEQASSEEKKLVHQLLKVWRRKKKRQRSPVTSPSRLRKKPLHPPIPVGRVAADGGTRKRRAIVIALDFAFEKEPAAKRGETGLLEKKTSIETTVNVVDLRIRVPLDIVDQPPET